MKKSVVVRLMALALGALVVLAPMASNAQPRRARAACVVVRQGALNLQLGYAPNGPRDCTRLP